MNEFFTWSMLLTSLGAGLATGIVVQLFKDYIKMPTQIFSYIVATIILCLATFFVSGCNISALAICPFNALLVGGGASNAVSFAQRQSKK